MIPILRPNNKYYINGDFGVVGARDKTDTPLHTHDFAEFVYVFHGSCIHTVNGRDYPAQKGDLLFINYNSTHSVRSETGVNYADILIKPAFIDESLRSTENAFSLLKLPDFRAFESAIRPHNCLVHFDGEERRRVEQLIRWATEEEERNEAGSALILRSFINLFLTLVFRKMALPLYTPLAVDGTLLDYIRDRCGDRLTLTALAEQCGYCSAYFSRRFRQYAGVTFSAYLTRCRLEKAMQLLADSSHSVETVMTECGFTDRTKFFKLFAAHTGHTPLKFRKKSKINTF